MSENTAKMENTTAAPETAIAVKEPWYKKLAANPIVRKTVGIAAKIAVPVACLYGGFKLGLKRGAAAIPVEGTVEETDDDLMEDDAE